jgi:glycosyltransferase involved in cell wall biosynthesis
MNIEKRRLALFLPSLHGGGAEKVMVNLARDFVERGIVVDLVLAKAEGTYLSEVPREVRVIDLSVPRVIASLPGLVRYLKREYPAVILSAMDHTNIVALWARKIAGVPCRLAISVHSTLSKSSGNAANFRSRLMPCLISRFYRWADVIITVSQGVADDLVKTTSLPQERVKVIYNPVITPEILEKARESLDHPWFALDQPPVILSVGRLTAAKDYPTLIRAFAFVRTKRPARLIILGKGKDRPKLEALVRELGLEEDISLPGFVDNPYVYMARAAVFVLSSIWEGLPTVLIEAMALGTPVVSTDCPSGPREIAALTKGCFLVPCGNSLAIGNAIIKVIDKHRSMVYSGLEPFTVHYSANMYEEVLFTS